MSTSVLSSSSFGIQNLPDELFNYLFTALADGYPAIRAKLGSETKPSLGWVVVSHACKRWRTIALHDCSKLWAQSFSAFPVALETMLLRAKDAPLSLDLAAFDRHVAVELISRAGRIEDELRSARASHLGDEWIRDLATKDLTRLYYLNLCNTAHNDVDPSIGLGIPKPLSDVLLNASALTHCYLPRYIPMQAPNLRVLHIYAPWECSVPEALGYLSTFPLLEDLYLCWRLKTSEKLNDSQTTRLDFPSLRSFTNDGGDSSILALLSRLNLPSAASLSFLVRLHDDFEHEWGVRSLDDIIQEMQSGVVKLYDYVSRSPHQSRASSCDTLIWYIEDDWFTQWMDLTTCMRSEVTCTSRGYDTTHGAIKIKLHGANDMPIEVLRPALKARFGAQNITTLYIDCSKAGSKVNELCKMLVDPVFSAVKELILYGSSQAIFSILDAHQDALKTSTSLVFPFLSSLVLDSCSNSCQTRQSATVDSPSHESSRHLDCGIWITKLYDVLLDQTKRSGRTLGQLTIKGRRDEDVLVCTGEDCERLTVESLMSVVDEFVDERTA
ncbi:hypothetical protein PENSPDRAFT_724785 [Peniophora sp. CONT]|nr:hypothetical protein PENSPDRAFT_724785 [Peniophora sp. CONT]